MRVSATTQARMQELEAQQRDLSRLLALAKEQAEQKLTREEIIATLELFCEGDINDKTYQEALIDTFLVAAYVYDDHFRFIFNVGDKTQEHNIPVDIDSVPDDTCISSGLGDQISGIRICGFRIFYLDEGFEHKIRQSDGLSDEPVQKPVRSFICAKGTNAPNPGAPTKQDRPFGYSSDPNGRSLYLQFYESMIRSFKQILNLKEVLYR